MFTFVLRDFGHVNKLDIYILLYDFPFTRKKDETVGAKKGESDNHGEFILDSRFAIRDSDIF